MKSVGLFAELFAFGVAISSQPEFLQREMLRTDQMNAAPSCAMLRNAGTHFTLDVAVGTPEQRFALVADTGSDSVIVRSCACESCQYPAGAEQKVCFKGSNRSSTFNLLESQGHLNVMQITFGSGTIQAVVATDVVKIGDIRVTLEGGLLLETAENLNIKGGIEGIVGLGPPKHTTVQKGAHPSPQHHGIKDMNRAISGDKPGGPLTSAAALLGGEVPGHAVQQVSFLERAKVSRFSMCFGGDEQGNGKLILNSPEPAKKLTNVGKEHWGLPVSSVSLAGGSDGTTHTDIGNASAPLCSDKSADKGTLMNCGMIPDSGTTLITAGKKHVEELLNSMCSQWDRCQRNLTALLDAKRAALNASERVSGFPDPFELKDADIPANLVLKLLLGDCDRWLPESETEAVALLNKEMPTVQFHLQGANKELQLIQLKPEHYVIEQLSVNSSIADKRLVSLLQGNPPKRVCMPAFGEMEYTTKENGPVWIMGTPLFYAYDVGYELEPKSMSFTEGTCHACGAAHSGHSLMSQNSTVAQRGKSAGKGLRRIEGAPRMPRIDPSKPF